MTKYLVTGGLGFIGSHLVDLLLTRGDSVIILDLATPNQPKPGVEYITGSIVDRTTVSQSLQGVDRVFHLAAKAGLWTYPKSDFALVNQIGTRNIMEESLAAGVELVVHTSTESILKSNKAQNQNHNNQKITDESIKLTFEDMMGAYCQGKFLAEQEAFTAYKKGLPVIIVNPTVPIGPGDRNLTPPSRMILGFVNGKYPFFLESMLNLIDVRDVAKGHLLAEEKGKIGERYILGNENIYLSKILENLEEISGLKMPKKQIPYWFALTISTIQEYIADNITHQPPFAPLSGVKIARTPTTFDNTKAIKELGITFTSLKESLTDALKWYEKQDLLTKKVKKLL